MRLPSAPNECYFDAAEVLEKMGGKYSPQAAQYLWEVINEPSSPNRSLAVRSLFILGNRYYREVEKRAPEMLIKARDPDLWGKAEDFDWLRRWVSKAPIKIERKEKSGYFSEDSRVRRKEAKAHEETIAWSAHSDRGSFRCINVGAVESLASLGPEFHKKAVRLVRSIQSWSWFDLENPEFKSNLGCALTVLGVEFSDEAIRLLRAGLEDPRRVKPTSYTGAARSLAKQGPLHHGEVIDALRKFASFTFDDPRARMDAASLLVILDPHKTEEAAKILRPLTTGEMGEVDDWCGAAELLSCFGGEWPNKAKNALAAIAADKKRPLWERADLADSLLHLQRMHP